MVNQTSAYVAGGVVPFRMGNAHPSLFPYEPLPTADGELIVAAGNDGAVPQAVRGARRPGARRRSAVRRNAGRTANRDELRPLLVERLRRPGTAAEWFDELIAAGVPVRADQHGRRAVSRSPSEIGLEPVVTVGPRRGGDAHDPAPDQLLRDPGQLPAAAAGARRARRGGPGLARGPPGAARGAADGQERQTDRDMTQPERSPYPHLARAPPTPDTITLLGQDLAGT